MRSKAAIQDHPIHPILVGFPIAMWVGGFIFELIGARWPNPGLSAAGFYCVIAGCIWAVMAAIPGIVDFLFTIPPNSSAKRRGLIHGVLNTLNLLLFIYVAYRLGSPLAQADGVTMLLMLIGLISLTIAGWMGATLVYRNQIGVERRYAGAGKLKTRSISSWDKPACHQSELGDGQMLLAIVGTERVVVGRCAEGLFAFGDHCTHRGGPLSDGALIACTVQCPWHGSQFDTRTGRVVAGPAQQKIVVYGVEIRNNEVFVQRPAEKHAEPPKAA
jgi:nitrite reductase/ring-hydroxylating ferredoxin subunit/uncharacterized membrane protein